MFKIISGKSTQKILLGWLSYKWEDYNRPWKNRGKKQVMDGVNLSDGLLEGLSETTIEHWSSRSHFVICIHSVIKQLRLMSG